MEYRGRYEIFDPQKITTYPVAERKNKVAFDDLVTPDQVIAKTFAVLPETEKAIVALVDRIVAARKKNKPVLWMTGAHMIKNGLGPLLVDLIQRNVVTLVGTNGAGCIHDFELALIGQTSEHVPNALPEGQFGMAYEFAYINEALRIGNEQKLGYGESLGRMICDDAFRSQVQQGLYASKPIAFPHPEVSMIATCYRCNIPLTCHASIGTDVIDQHPNFDGSAKGGCSGRDFLIYAQQVCQLADGGVALNIGSAVTGPEVLLKAVSMAGNVGCVPMGLITADFDLKPYYHDKMKDEANYNYYFRHHKSVATRVPEAFNGAGYYVQGDQNDTLPRFYQELRKHF